LTADTEEELHDFARRIGLRREWFQSAVNRRGWYRRPHYDLTGHKRFEAVAAGAIERDPRDRPTANS
jgi:hypothetical protein